MNEITKPKGISVKFFNNSNFNYFLCPNCYEYLILDECLECGLICEIEEISSDDIEREKNRCLTDVAKLFGNLFPLITRSY